MLHNCTQFQKKVKKSFALTRQDVYTLYEHIQYLHTQVNTLQEENKKLLANAGITGVTLVASKTGKKAHVSSCLFAKNIKKPITITSNKEAIAKGYSLCNCAA